MIPLINVVVLAQKVCTIHVSVNIILYSEHQQDLFTLDQAGIHPESITKSEAFRQLN